MNIREEKLAIRQLVEQGRALLNKAETEKRALTAEESASWDKLMAEVDTRSQAVEREEKLVAAEKASILAAEQNRAKDKAPETPEQRYTRAFDAYLRAHMFNPLSPEDAAVIAEQRAAATTSGTTGGAAYFIPQGFLAQVEEALLAYGGMVEASNVMRTSQGNLMYLPQWNDTAQSSAIRNELSAISATGGTYPTFGREQLEAYSFATDCLRVTWEALQDSAFDLQGMLARALGTRMARGLNTLFTTGSGSSTAEGVVSGATSALTAASSSALTADELVRLFHSVDPLYRTGPKVRWMFNDTTFLALRRLKDGNGQFLWEPGLKAGEPATLLGKPFTVNQSVADIGSAAKPILFGDFSKFTIRLVGNPALVVLDQLYAMTRETGYYLWQRVDSVLQDAGTHPIKYITCAS